MLPDPTPLSGADLDARAAGLDPISAAVASVAAGLEAGELERLLADTPDAPAFLGWDAGATPPAALPGSGRLAVPFDAEVPARHQPPAVRLALTGNLLPAEVVPRLLACPGVGSVALPVQRPPGALRRRTWHWPPRIGVAEDGLRDAFAAQAGDGTVPPELQDVTDIRAHPGGVDLLVLRVGPAEAAAFVAARRQLAGIVVCADDGGAWPVVDAHLALVRAATGAVATAVVPPGGAADVAAAVRRALRYLSHGHPLDVALTAGFDRQLLLAGEIEALSASTLPETLRRRARQARFDLEMAVGAEPPEPPALDVLEALPDGAFDHETEEATRAVEPSRAVEAVLDEAEAAVPRLLQARVGPVDGPADNVLRAGANAVDVFVGPEEAGALVGHELTDEQLGFTDPAVDGPASRWCWRP